MLVGGSSVINFSTLLFGDFEEKLPVFIAAGY